MVSYAEERSANIERNKLILKEIGMEKLKPATEPKEKRKKKKTPRNKNANNKRKMTNFEVPGGRDPQAVEQPPTKTARVDSEVSEVPGESRRRSSRIASLPAGAVVHAERRRGTPLPMSVKTIVPSASGAAKRQRRYDPKTYGAIPGIEVGSWWASREECSNDSIHAPWVGGISPGPHGAYSVALSGGYDDDVDAGYAFTYTGAGGRDLKGTKAAPKNLRTAEQSYDQSFDHNHNKALKRSVETGKPVRVIRGFKLRSPYGPSEGYRYDGLYTVERHWQEKGLNKGGFLVCKFAFKRLPGQPDIPVRGGEDEEPEFPSGDEESDAEGVDTSDD
ncbi:hypothetical protein PAXRUDRAFT_398876 [Paxillus rubicundulus Ve08.2h10]|uniref:YDG domain-containing protein n=1 Tax=Paxillus rubicundulus Ve08.2h10 TaxID=930991 RepID=A0A0D0E343_9AGAM|nr:hypothetical protein PAXRUDRAFT_398876 [Paxillus rubicundulus Ve08.2h10]